MTTPPRPARGWRTSSYSGSGNNCVEVAPHRHAVAVRDSHNPHGPALLLTPAAWADFTRRLKASDSAPSHSD